jgi:acetoacetate decarboxylase
MSFLATPEQIEAFKQRVSNPNYTQEAISVEFTTSHDFIASVLPPTFKPAESSTGIISVSTWESNVCGSFELSSVSVKCVCDGREGYWVLHLIVSDSFAITWGRETWGEIKKEGKIQLTSRGAQRMGYMERHGVRLIELEAEFDAPSEDPQTMKWVDFEVKAFPNALGTGLHSDPQLIALEVEVEYVAHATGKGKLTLRGARSDPLHAIPIQSVGEFSYYKGPSHWRVFQERSLCPAKEYMPYFVARHYDHVLDYPLGKGMKSIVDVDESEDAAAVKVPRSWTSG